MGQAPLLQPSCGVRIRRQRIKKDQREGEVVAKVEREKNGLRRKVLPLPPLRNKEEGAQGGKQVLTGTSWCGNLCRDYFLSKGTDGGDWGPVWGCMGRRNLNLTFFKCQKVE